MSKQELHNKLKTLLTSIPTTIARPRPDLDPESLLIDIEELEKMEMTKTRPIRKYLVSMV